MSLPPRLRLRLPELHDESAMRDLNDQLAAEGFSFLLHKGTWSEIIDAIRRESAGVDIPADRVRADYLVAETGAAIVGRASIRYVLNDFLLHEGGHVGYAVGPEFRGRGYATAILRHSLELLQEAGVAEALLVHDDGNDASRTVIQRCGGVLDDVRLGTDGLLKHRYWVPTAATASR